MSYTAKRVAAGIGAVGVVYAMVVVMILSTGEALGTTGEALGTALVGAALVGAVLVALVCFAALVVALLAYAAGDFPNDEDGE